MAGIVGPMTPEAFLAALPADRQADARALDALIRASMPGAGVEAAGGMLGYSPFRYRYATGREGDSFKVSLASRAAGFSLYLNAVDEGGYLAEQAARSLGKVSVGRSCIRFKRFADLEEKALKALLAKAHAMKGAGEA